jgi:uncharacterized protein (DUF2147 family)
MTGIKVVFSFFVLMLFASINSNAQSVPKNELICGKWESSENNLIVQVYMMDNKFMAKIVWFRNTDGEPMDYWKDEKNPDPKLRSRKILGMSVLKDLNYEADTNSWEDGIIYDSKHGREWNASAYIDKDGLLKVKGYWHFKFIGHTLIFKRV